MVCAAAVHKVHITTDFIVLILTFYDVSQRVISTPSRGTTLAYTPRRVLSKY